MRPMWCFCRSSPSWPSVHWLMTRPLPRVAATTSATELLALLKARTNGAVETLQVTMDELAAVMEGIKERIAADPYASRFALTGPLRRYGRLKGLGLPDRYRLFFRPFEAEGRRLLLIHCFSYAFLWRCHALSSSTAIPNTSDSPTHTSH